MPHVSAMVSSPVYDSFRVQQVIGMFDLPAATESRSVFSAEIPSLDEAWTIGAIVGPSGSGKTTIAKRAFGDAMHPSKPWAHDRAIIDGFGDCSIKVITQMLTSVGFGSPPAWLRPYHVLSNGEQFRCDLARAMLSAAHPASGERAGGAPGLVVFDEFTSVVDRTVAQIGSSAISKALRRQERACRFVAVSCHYDILSWLEPDWSLDLATGELSRVRLRRPSIELEVVRCSRRAWPLFSRHHYLGGEVPAAAQCYLAVWRGEPVAFCAVTGLFGHKRRKRLSRIVTLPDYQGVGMGTRLMEYVCQQQAESGFRVNLTASHPAMIAHCARSPRWRTIDVSRFGHLGAQFNRGQRFRGSQGRSVVSFEFVGDEQHESASSLRAE